MDPLCDLQVLWRQFLKFKETELPAKEADKNRSKYIFKSFEVSFLSGSSGFVSDSHLVTGCFEGYFCAVQMCQVYNMF